MTISLDDYFRPQSETPLDQEGKPDFESLGALDVERLNDSLVHLLKNEEVETPIFDFHAGTPKPAGRRMKLPERAILILEGIHGLNDALTPLIERSWKHKIYVSALTQLNLDDHNRVSTTDNRLIRRMVRDSQFRGHTAQTTLSMWGSVRRGEDRNIFPFQNAADSAFNSALDYELSVLKVYAEPLLVSVKPDSPEYQDARALMGFLANFAPLHPRWVPPTSILREGPAGTPAAASRSAAARLNQVHGLARGWHGGLPPLFLLQGVGKVQGGLRLPMNDEGLARR